MQKRPPPLDLIRGFEAAARHLSFTRAGQELFLTQSAVSRQVQALEEWLGVQLFERRHRALLLTEEGQLLYRAAAGALRELQETMARIAGLSSARMVTVTAMVTLSALLLVPRLPAFRQRHPQIDVRIAADNALLDLERSRIDVAIRYVAKDRAPAGAAQLFAEEVLPVCSPKLLRDRARPLKAPADLRHHVLLHLDDPPGLSPYLEWDNWLDAMGLAQLKPAGDLRFSHYDQLIASAVEGQGIALGRLPMLRNHLRQRKLVAPFERDLLPGRRPQSSRAFFVVRAARSARPEVEHFVNWLHEEARRDQE
jgi:LysR family transcriptional regulator, glycine cleavage system transcriptional activator